ncbi:MAG: hypothetical protein AAGD01_08720 [Acidobacteriota bacterium]
MKKTLEYNATLREKIDLTASLSIFRVEPDGAGDEALSDFLPGQYGVLGLNNEDRPELGSVRRPMSLVSAPEEVRGESPKVLEFYIRYVHHPESDNPLTHLLWRLEAGDRLFVGPKIAGRFTAEDTVGAEDQRLRLCVAAGTGLAPFLSFARSQALADPAADLSQLAILHGASYPADLGYGEELEQLASERGLIYRRTVSRPHEAPNWPGDAGRVEDYFLADRLPELDQALGFEADGGVRPENTVIFICGLQGTIGQTFLRLLDRGFVPENRRLRGALEIPAEVEASLFFEQYDTTPVVDLKDEALIADLRSRLHDALESRS